MDSVKDINYPHQCPKCGGAAYVSFMNDVDCKTKCGLKDLSGFVSSKTTTKSMKYVGSQGTFSGDPIEIRCPICNSVCVSTTCFTHSWFPYTFIKGMWYKSESSVFSITHIYITKYIGSPNNWEWSSQIITRK